MASKNQKKTTSKKKATGKKPAAKQTAAPKPAQSQSRPVRREVGGLVLVVLMLCTVVSYFGVNAILVDWLAKLIKGLFGYGYWIAAPAMLLAAVVLLVTKKRMAAES